ncbi:DUF4349 domain-containing protein [Streptomyces spectabilis]|uniref:DUF4349 domain-containing protein n=1 Tax=Streptomyces spectabilis TaxID=68270 RepID=A0A516RF38_STRST|nr:DUF4349 domain-containing protein [Streptomyces spectabilis]QDQ14264.1 DUF4349 domain-containing protein [Streptomyces spectabilis]
MRRSRTGNGARALAVALLAGALALTGCGASGDDSSGKGSEDSAARSGRSGGGEDAALVEGGAGAGRADGDDKAAAPGGKEAGRAKKPGERLRTDGPHIIRTASLTVRVRDVPKALDRARSAASQANGLVGDETTDRDGHGRERSRVVLRVPQERYTQVLSDLEGTGKLVSRTAKAEDVTEEVVDVESRIRTQRASVARVRELMDKATKISDIVSLEGELSTRQADLEALLARQASLKDRTALATITLTLTESPAGRGDDGDDDPTVVDALAGGWGAFLTMLRWAAVALGAALPFVVGAALLGAAWLRWGRGRAAAPPRPAGAPETTPGTPDGP